MPFDGRAIANFVLDWCEAQGRAITPFNLQKITFFCHAWSLIRLGKPLVKHAFEAWEYGPVLPYLYRDFKSYGETPITARAKILDIINSTHKIVTYSFDEELERLLKDVVDFYSQLRASDLFNMTHAPGSPWYVVWHHKGRANPGMRIENAEILRFYSTLPAPFANEYGAYQ